MPRLVENAEVSRLFQEMADLLEIQGANPFRVRAYRTAARTIDEQAGPVAALARARDDGLEDLPGIGEDLAGKIREIVRTGTLRDLVALRRRVPRGLVEFTRLRGVGPKRAVALAEALGISTLAGLKRALDRGQVRTVPGFGARTEARLRQELATRQATPARVPRPVAAQYGESLRGYLAELAGVQRVEIAGSFRRCKDTVGDLDLLVTARRGTAVTRRFTRFPEVAEVLAEGETSASVRLASGLQVDLRVLPAASFGAGLYYFTGSRAHNIAVRRLAQRRGLKINEYGVFRGSRRIAGRTEAEVAATVGLPLIPPELREDRGEIAAARAGRLPRLVTASELRGDLQCHTTGSDGRDDLATMLRAAERLGREYVAITDHSPALRVTGGLDRAGLTRQRAAIDRLNARGGPTRLLAGIEVEILADGSLDLDDRTLAGLDLVVGAIHTRLELPAREQTRRLVRAIRHPRMQVIAHPTGRLIGERPPMHLDLEAVFRAAADCGVLLEVNAQPSRLDLDDQAVMAALAAGVGLVISSDAHSAQELRLLPWGVDQARRGWATAADIATTLPLDRFLARIAREG